MRAGSYTATIVVTLVTGYVSTARTARKICQMRKRRFANHPPPTTHQSCQWPLDEWRESNTPFAFHKTITTNICPC